MIVKRLDGRYEVILEAQDTERADFSTEQDAVDAYIQMRCFLFNEKKEEITVPRIIDRTQWPEFVAGDNGLMTVSYAQINQALDLALHQTGDGLEPGHRYVLKISLVEREDPTFQGEGI